MRLTPFAKLFIALVIIVAVGYVIKVKLRDEIITARDRPSGPSDPPGSGPGAPPGKEPLKRIVIGVNDFGGGYPLLLANDGAKAGPNSLFRQAGLDVEVRLIRGSKERLKAFDDGEVQVMLLTLDYLANLAPIYKQKNVELRSFLFVDWSRGNIGIAAKPQYKSIEELKGARIATTRNTPTHYLLLSLLDKSNLKPAEIDTVKSNIVWATKTPEAGSLFQRGEVDAVAIWEPHLSEAIEGGKGVTLVSTETATNLVADVLFARKEFLDENRDKIASFVQAFFQAVEMLNKDPAHTIELASAAFQQKPELVTTTLKKIKPAQFADNRAFFGMETEDCAYDQLFVEASGFWQREGLIKEAVAPGQTKWLKALDSVAAQYRNQTVVESFQFQSLQKRQASSLLTKSVSIYFDTGKSEVEPNARKVLDGFAQTLQVFQNAYVQVEGNTDNVGNRAANVALSKQRAEAVIAYLVERHRLLRGRFLAIGNGPDAPVADNRTPQGRELNRRTDFKIIKNTQDGASAAPAAPAANAPAAERENQPMITGQMDAKQVQAGIRQHIGEFRACYTAALAQKPSLAGRVVLRFTIDAAGKVSESQTADSTLADATVEKCLTLVAQRMQFAKPAGAPVRISYPLVFKGDTDNK